MDDRARALGLIEEGFMQMHLGPTWRLRWAIAGDQGLEQWGMGLQWTTVPTTERQAWLLEALTAQVERTIGRGWPRDRDTIAVVTYSGPDGAPAVQRWHAFTGETRTLALEGDPLLTWIVAAARELLEAGA